MKQKYKLPSLIKLTWLVLVGGFLTGCASSNKIDRNYLYFQTGRDSSILSKVKERIIRPTDQLSIQILSKTLNQEQVAIFNLAAGSGTGPGTATNGYLVGNDGNIDIPILGSIKAEGLTKVQLQQLLARRLTPYIRDPAVIVKFLQFSINVLGEVKGPGVKTFNTDQVTLLDAISASGDLSDVGKREDITVIREENGKMKYTQVDIRSGAFFNSPVYQLQPNDIVYVGANRRKLIANNINPNSGRTFGTITGIISLALTMVYFVITLTKL